MPTRTPWPTYWPPNDKVLLSLTHPTERCNGIGSRGRGEQGLPAWGALGDLLFLHLLSQAAGAGPGLPEEEDDDDVEEGGAAPGSSVAEQKKKKKKKNKKRSAAASSSSVSGADEPIVLGIQPREPTFPAPTPG